MIWSVCALFVAVAVFQPQLEAGVRKRKEDAEMSAAHPMCSRGLATEGGGWAQPGPKDSPEVLGPTLRL